MMESGVKGIRPSKLDACIENITRTLAQKSQEETSHHSKSDTNFYKTEACKNLDDNDSSLKIKIRKVGTYQTPEELKPYECPVCHKKISNQANLRTHIRTHTGDKPHRCGICGKSFSRNGTLQTHLTIHSGVKLFKCEICGREIRDRGNLSKHMKIHLSNILPKKESETVNESQIYIPKRDIDVINESLKNVSKKGNLSNMKTSQLDMIKKEIFALNNSQFENLTKKNETLNNSSFDTPKLPTHSKFDSASDLGISSLTKGDSLRKDLPETLNFQKPDSNKTEALHHEKNRNSQDNVISYNCGLCLISFSNTDSYFSHMMTHARDQRQSGPEFYDVQEPCPDRGKRPVKQETEETFPESGEQEMFAAYEREMRAWDQRFSQRGHNFMSLQADLSKSSQFLRQEKEQSIVTPMEQEMLQVYEREMKFYQEQKVKQAERMHGQFGNEQKMAADGGLVKAGDDNDDDGYEDMETEEEKRNYKCGICGNEYNTKDSFEDHITIHKVDKPYQCTICLEQFKELRYLQKHIRGHRGLNPFWCEKCGKEFSQGIYLIEHLQKHSDDQPSGSNMNGDFNTSSKKLPHQQQPQGDSNDMFIVIE